MLAFLIGSPVPRSHESRLERVLEFYGAPYRTVRGSTLPSVIAEIEFVLHQHDGRVCAITSGEVLGELLQGDANGAAELQRLTRVVPFLFVFDFPRTGVGIHILNELSGGTLAPGPQNHGNEVVFRISPESSKFTFELTGYSFVSACSVPESRFTLKNDSANIQKLITADGHPFLVNCSRPEGALFLSGGSQIEDIDAPADDRFAVSHHFSSLVPFIMFLRSVFGNQIWHASGGPSANLIIDDPLLRSDYGFLNFSALVQKADELNFTTTLAFIPWNYGRSEKSTVDLFHRRGDRLGMCVHGCDHIAAEFAETDLARLNMAVDLATQRMMAHQAITGLSFIKAMVFPQGYFSAPSLLALKCNDYLAAINTEVFPKTEPNQGLTVRDLLGLAITKYHGFPIFQRRYPESAGEFSFDFFLGKPLFIVEHHELFRNGFGRLRELVNSIQQIAPNIQWQSASDMLLKSCMLRKSSPTELECKSFSRVQIIENPEPYDMDLTIIRWEPQVDLIREVTVNGRPAEFTARDALIKVGTRISAGGTVRFELKYVNNLPRRRAKPSLTMKSKVAMRRYLSEFRDNVLAKNATVLSAAKFVKNHLP